jgi:hypothetical protein
MTVDEINFRLRQNGEAAKGNVSASHKYNGKYALCYKLGISILGPVTGDISTCEGAVGKAAKSPTMNPAEKKQDFFQGPIFQRSN